MDNIANMMYSVLILGLAVVVFAEEDFGTKRSVLENPNLFQGDILREFDHDRNAIVGEIYRWPNARVPYVIGASMEDDLDLLQKAFQHYHDNTCVRFVPRTDEEKYIFIFRGEGCYSALGMMHYAGQHVSLGEGCQYLSTFVHELGHALGFLHEHSRSDRDDYITIHLENALPGMEIQFGKVKPTQNILYNKFDYQSVMIYDSKSFSKNGKPTMVGKNGNTLREPYQDTGMTDSDIYRVNKMYNCS